MQISGPELTALRRQAMGQDGHNQFNHRQCPNLFLNLETRPLSSLNHTPVIEPELFSLVALWVGLVG